MKIAIIIGILYAIGAFIATIGVRLAWYLDLTDDDDNEFITILSFIVPWIIVVYLGGLFCAERLKQVVRKKFL